MKYYTCSLSVVYILIFSDFFQYTKCYEDLSALEGAISNELKQRINESMYQRLQSAYIELLLKPLESGVSKTYYARHVSTMLHSTYGPDHILPLSKKIKEVWAVSYKSKLTKISELRNK